MNPCTALHYIIKNVFDLKVLDLSLQIKCGTTDFWVLFRKQTSQSSQCQLQGDAQYGGDTGPSFIANTIMCDVRKKGDWHHDS